VFERDTKIRNAGTFAIEKEDHTIGNSVRAQLLKRRSVLFAGYKMPHPLEHRIVIKVQTDLDTTPQNEMQESIHELIQDLLELEQQFRVCSLEKKWAQLRDIYVDMIYILCCRCILSGIQIVWEGDIVVGILVDSLSGASSWRRDVKGELLRM
tara:strand:- start:274 stop:732 length:459 start_codon:yes stop_codon:yes gene_type:complete